MTHPTWPAAGDLTSLLCAVDWLDRSGAHPIRYVFRRDGSGYCDREAASGERPVFEKLLWKVAAAEPARAATGHRSVEFQLKFAHVREWLGVEALLGDGPPPTLTFALDPWVLAVQERRTEAQRLIADTGPALDDA